MKYVFMALMIPFYLMGFVFGFFLRPFWSGLTAGVVFLQDKEQLKSQVDLNAIIKEYEKSQADLNDIIQEYENEATKNDP